MAELSLLATALEASLRLQFNTSRAASAAPLTSVIVDMSASHEITSHHDRRRGVVFFHCPFSFRFAAQYFFILRLIALFCAADIFFRRFLACGDPDDAVLTAAADALADGWWMRILRSFAISASCSLIRAAAPSRASSMMWDECLAIRRPMIVKTRCDCTRTRSGPLATRRSEPQRFWARQTCSQCGLTEVTEPRRLLAMAPHSGNP